MGNICRSPMAEAVFQHLVTKAGLADQFRIDSAGTSGWHEGQSPHVGTQRVLADHHIPYDGHARQVDLDDFERFDYLLVMDRENLQAIQRVANSLPATKVRAQIALFLQFAKEAGLVKDDEVSDPYYHGRFEDTYALITLGAQELLAHIRKTHQI